MAITYYHIEISGLNSQPNNKKYNEKDCKGSMLIKLIPHN
jgi:hypothetical protein